MWLAEHHFSTYGYLSRPVQLATYIAGRDDAAAGGHGGDRRPAAPSAGGRRGDRHLDVVSGGRMDIGLGRGYQQYEFERFGFELDAGREPLGRIDSIIFQALEGKPFTYEGKHFKLPETSIFPQPVQKPHRRCGSWRRAPTRWKRRCGRGFNEVTGGFGVPVCSHGLRPAVQQGGGRRPAEGGCGVSAVQRPVYVTGDAADVRDAVEHARWNMRVTLSLRHNRERVEKGVAIPVPGEKEPDVDMLLGSM